MKEIRFDASGEEIEDETKDRPAITNHLLSR